eukprot:4406992-Pyramimonas_sp.AAC.1
MERRNGDDGVLSGGCHGYSASLDEGDDAAADDEDVDDEYDSGADVDTADDVAADDDVGDDGDVDGDDSGGGDDAENTVAADDGDDVDQAI